MITSDFLPLLDLLLAVQRLCFRQVLQVPHRKLARAVVWCFPVLLVDLIGRVVQARRTCHVDLNSMISIDLLDREKVLCRVKLTRATWTTEVITAHVPPSGRIEVRAARLAESIERQANGKAVNIIAFVSFVFLKLTAGTNIA